MSKNILNILVVSASSLPLARKIRDKYQGKTIIYCREADNDVEPFTSFEELAGDLFNKSEAMLRTSKVSTRTRQSSALTVPANMSCRYYPAISAGRMS